MESLLGNVDQFWGGRSSLKEAPGLLDPLPYMGQNVGSCSNRPDGVRVAVLLDTVPLEQAAAHNMLQSNIKPNTFLASLMLDAPSGLFRTLSIFSALFKVGRGEESHYAASPMERQILRDKIVSERRKVSI